MVKVTGDGSGLMSERILRHQNAADVTEVGSECELSLKIPRQTLFFSVTNFENVKIQNIKVNALH